MAMSGRSPKTDSRQMELPSMPSAADSPVRISAAQEKALEWRANGRDYGASTPVWLASYDRATSSWRTSQHCLVEGLAVFSETWPRSGTMRNGIAYRLPPLVRLTDEIEFGSFPTPQARDWKGPQGRAYSGETMDLPGAVMWPTPHGFSQDGRSNGPSGNELGRAVNQSLRNVPTPTSRDHKDGSAQSCANVPTNGLLGRAVHYYTPTARDHMPSHSEEYIAEKKSQGQGMGNLNDQIGGSLNPTWVEWLMGFPLGWTVLKDWATRSSRKSRNLLDDPS